jgi:hypothetical protein
MGGFITIVTIATNILIAISVNAHMRIVQVS